MSSPEGTWQQIEDEMKGNELKRDEMKGNDMKGDEMKGNEMNEMNWKEKESKSSWLVSPYSVHNPQYIFK